MFDECVSLSNCLDSFLGDVTADIDGNCGLDPEKNEKLKVAFVLICILFHRRKFTREKLLNDITYIFVQFKRIC